MGKLYIRDEASHSNFGIRDSRRTLTKRCLKAGRKNTRGEGGGRWGGGGGGGEEEKRGRKGGSSISSAADVTSAGELCGREIPREQTRARGWVGGGGDWSFFQPRALEGEGGGREDKWAAFIAEFMRARACLICGEDLKGRRHAPFNPLRSPCRRRRLPEDWRDWKLTYKVSRRGGLTYDRRRWRLKIARANWEGLSRATRSRELFSHYRANRARRRANNRRAAVRGIIPREGLPWRTTRGATVHGCVFRSLRFQFRRAIDTAAVNNRIAGERCR